MLKYLKIKNIALIDEIKIDFDKGFNVLTGETGAGKSIIIDSLQFVLGSKADKSLIKNGADFSFVEAVFEINENNLGLTQELENCGVEVDNIIKISRTMNINSKNECKINGEIVPLTMLKKVTNYLVDIFGQNDNHILLDEKNHLTLLDNYCDAKTKEMCEEKLNLSNLLSELRDINSKIKSLGGVGADKAKAIELIKYEINEIEIASLKENEEETLNQRKMILLNSEKIANGLNNALNYLYYSMDVGANIKSSIVELKNIEKFDDKLTDFITRLQNARYEIEDICGGLEDKKSNIEYSEIEINKIEERLEVINDLKRKYGNSINKILEYLQNNKEKLHNLETCEEQLNACLTEKKEVLNKILLVCNKISNIRKKYSNILEKQIILNLKDLNMKNANMKIEFLNNIDISSIENIVGINGADNVRFLFSANSGEPLKELSKIISGGEMSRFMLAFKCANKTDDPYKTYVFDEIDAGIGGDAGTATAKKIAEISTINQVFCITHLPQIACFSDAHFKVEKVEKNNTTKSIVTLLDKQNKELEITRMIGLINDNNFAILHAKVLISDAENYKKCFI